MSKPNRKHKQHADSKKLIAGQARPEWQEFLDVWDKLDGSEWQAPPRAAYDIERNVFADWGK